MNGGHRGSAPLATLSDGTPLLFPTLGAVFHLDALEPAHEAALDAVNDLVWDWFGDQLQWSYLSCGGFEEARRSHADYISGYADNLDVTLPAGLSEEMQLAARNVIKVGRNDYAVFLNGGKDLVEASPFSYRFWAEIEPDEPPDAPFFMAYGVLHITVPDDWPIDDFEARIMKIASLLPLRWGAAGYTYSPWIIADDHAPGEAIYRHARRHPGFDVADYQGKMSAFYTHIRTVNWLTFLGPPMITQLQALGRRIEATPNVSVGKTGSNVVLRAGARPARGDSNRLDLPAAYREADALVRPIRAAQGGDLSFFGPWEPHEVTDWLRRFERRVS